MPLKFRFVELFKGRSPIPKFLYEQLEDLQKQIDEQHIVKEDVKINKTQLTKAFGKPEEFRGMGIVRNPEAVYLIVSNGKNFEKFEFKEV